MSLNNDFCSRQFSCILDDLMQQYAERQRCMYGVMLLSPGLLNGSLARADVQVRTLKVGFHKRRNVSNIPGIRLVAHIPISSLDQLYRDSNLNISNYTHTLFHTILIF